MDESRGNKGQQSPKKEVSGRVRGNKGQQSGERVVLRSVADLRVRSSVGELVSASPPLSPDPHLRYSLTLSVFPCDLLMHLSGGVARGQSYPPDQQRQGQESQEAGSDDTPWDLALWMKLVVKGVVVKPLQVVQRPIHVGDGCIEAAWTVGHTWVRMLMCYACMEVCDCSTALIDGIAAWPIPLASGSEGAIGGLSAGRVAEPTNTDLCLMFD